MDNCTYPIASSKENIVLLLNNTNGRDGAHFDSQNMKELWKTITGKDPIVREDLNAENMFQEIEKISKLDKTRVNYIVIIISCRGRLQGDREIQCPPDRVVIRREGVETTTFEKKTEVIIGNDDNLVEVSDILELFSNDNAPNLIGIPKFFIFQFDRGTNDVRRPSAQHNPKHYRHVDAASVRVPEISDMLVAYSTHPGYSSDVQAESGSPFIAKIKQIFEKCYESEQVLDMLTRVNAEMERICENGEAMSKFESSLTRKFFLKAVQQSGQTVAEPL